MLKSASLGLALALCLSANPAGAWVEPMKSIPALAVYATPQRLVEVAPGQRIHLYCQGKGSPTVVLTAGLGGWSSTWGLVLPDVAKQTRVCSWDRAGFGHSDGSAAPLTAANNVADLERALAGAGEAAPYVLVGHSAGVYEVLGFTDHRPGDVAGIVLVDPARPHDMAREEAVSPRAAAMDRDYFKGESQRLRTCAAGVEAGTVATGKPAEPCFQYYPELPEGVQLAMAKRDAEPARLRSQASSFEEYEPNGERAVKPGRSYGDKPLIVLTAALGQTWPDELKAEAPRLNADWAASHLDLTALSSQGQRRIVEESGHLVQLERPDAVITAITDVVAAARKR